MECSSELSYEPKEIHLRGGEKANRQTMSFPVTSSFSSLTLRKDVHDLIRVVEYEPLGVWKLTLVEFPRIITCDNFKIPVL